MILLTKFDIINNPTEEPSTRIDNQQFIAIDGWSVISIEPYKYNGGHEGSKLFVGEGRGFINVRECMTDVIGLVEAEVNRDKNNQPQPF